MPDSAPRTVPSRFSGAFSFDLESIFQIHHVKQILRGDAQMALRDFRLSQDQRDGCFVVVLADDGKIRVIARVTREAIEDHFELHEVSDRQRIALVESNLPQIGRLIAKKYQAGEHTTYTDRLGITDERNRLIIIASHDLNRGERLSDACLTA